MKILIWILKIIVAGFLAQTVLLYKFPAHPESVTMFTEFSDFIGNIVSESFLRNGTGIIELIACILLLIPKTSKIGVTLLIAILVGAIVSHLVFISADVPMMYIAIVLLAICGFIASRSFKTTT